MTLDDLTVSFAHLDRERILEDWQWLIGEEGLPILITASGDAFIQDPFSLEISFLDVIAGDLRKVAISGDEFKTLLSEPEFVKSHFGVEMISDLMNSDINLESSQVYSFKIPPVLGGAQSIDNVGPTDIEVHFSLAGQIHKRVRDLPEGTPVSSVKLES